MTPLERAARAIVAEIRATGEGKLEPWYSDFEPETPITEEIAVDGGLIPMDLARAVLTAIREPSEAMSKSGGDALDDGTGAAGSNHAAEACFRAMIDAALAEEG